MYGIKKVFALLIASALLIGATPTAKAAADIIGTWTGANEYYTMTIAFYGDNTYDTRIEQDGQQVEVSGMFSMDESFLYFLPGGGQLSALNYYIEGDVLGLYEPQSGETIYLERRQPAAAVPAGLAGTWTGVDEGETVYLTFSEDGTSALAYNQPDAPGVSGAFTAANGILEAQFSDGSDLYLQFMLVGDTLVLADAEQTLTLTRYTGLLPTPAPTFAPIQPTEEPTPAPAGGGLAGTWLGGADAGVRQLVLTEDGKAALSSAENPDAPREGTYTNDETALTLTFENGATEVFQYLLIGDSLLLMKSGEAVPSNMTREAAAAED